jgi:tRNA-2-methylthio-N6-dimethylallyladenosine synthase
MSQLPAKKLHLKTWGCQMNVYDSQRMADVLAPLGYGLTEEAAEADLVILNTCHIREKAAEKLYSELGRMKDYQQDRAAKGERMMVAVAGCVAQAEGAEIIKRAPNVDLVFGPQTYHTLPEMVGRAMRESGVVNTDFPVESKFDHLPEAQATSGKSAFLSVQEGCDKFCTFCVVPYTRGAEASRSVQPVLDEAKRLLDQGIIELNLLGQNVNAFHGTAADGSVWSLARLIAELAKDSRLKRIRYTTSHPRDMSDDLIEAHRDIPALMPYLHLPIQSGSNPVLAAMNRKHTRADYLKIVDKLRAAKPDLALSSDFIVGFPGEREQDFQDTLDLVMNVGFASAFSFSYSARPGTPASGLGHQVDEAVKHERLQRLQAALAQQSRHFNATKVGQTLPVLLEKVGRKPGQLIGKSPWLQSVVCQADTSLIGSIVDVRIDEAHANSLLGDLLPIKAVA